jgi:putative salt-induced outer membrane protein
MAVRRYLLMLTTLPMCAPALAEDVPPGGWAGEGELGYTRTTGNTDSESLIVKLGFKRESPQWRLGFNVEAVDRSENDVTSARRYFAAAKSDYKLTQRSYVFGAADYEDDRFSGFDYRANVAIGYGHRVVDGEALTLDLEAGPGARFSRLETGESDTEATLRLAGNLGWKISPTAKLTEETSAVIGEDSTVYRSLTVLTTKINSDLALRVSYLYKHSTDVPPDTVKTDTETVVTLVYSF